jgi:hypothetical protein
MNIFLLGVAHQKIQVVGRALRSQSFSFLPVSWFVIITSKMAKKKKDFRFNP